MTIHPKTCFGAQEIVLLADAEDMLRNVNLLPDLVSRLSALASKAASAMKRGHEATAQWLQQAQVDRLGWRGAEMIHEELALERPSLFSQQQAALIILQNPAFQHSTTADVVAVAHLVIPALGIDVITVHGPD